MSEETKQPATSVVAEPEPEVIKAFSVQPTGMVETTYAETIGLSMHNAILSQQNSQMITQASVTNACARLLTIPSLLEEKKEEDPKDGDEQKAAEGGDAAEASQAIDDSEQKQPRKLNISNFFKRKKSSDDESGEATKTKPKVNSVLDLGNEPSKKGTQGDGEGN